VTGGPSADTVSCRPRLCCRFVVNPRPDPALRGVSARANAQRYTYGQPWCAGGGILSYDDADPRSTRSYSGPRHGSRTLPTVGGGHPQTAGWCGVDAAQHRATSAADLGRHRATGLADARRAMTAHAAMAALVASSEAVDRRGLRDRRRHTDRRELPSSGLLDRGRRPSTSRTAGT
jgi:hypothetical protein